MLTALWIVLALLAILALPVWPHSRVWGYLPAGGIALLLLTLVLLHLEHVI